MTPDRQPGDVWKKFTDTQLREALESGEHPKAIALRLGVNHTSVYRRMKRLGVTTVAAVSATRESKRYVARTIDALDELVANLNILHRLRDEGERMLAEHGMLGPQMPTLMAVLTEVRSTVNAAADLARLLSDVRAMEAFREAMLEEIRKVDPDIAQRIADAVRRSILLRNTAGGFTALATGNLSDLAGGEGSEQSR